MFLPETNTEMCSFEELLSILIQMKVKNILYESKVDEKVLEDKLFLLYGLLKSNVAKNFIMQENEESAVYAENVIRSYELPGARTISSPVYERHNIGKLRCFIL